MADIRIKDLATTASSTAADDFLAVDGTTNGTRKLSAATPSFATSVTVPGVASPAATNLTLGTGTYGTALTFASSTGAATFAGAVTVASTTSASSSTVGALTVGNGTAATNVAIGGGNIYSGGSVYNNGSGYFWDVSGVTRLRAYMATASSMRFFNGSVDSFIFDLANNNLSIAGTTPSTGAGSGALQVAGGIYSGAASVFGGNVTIPSSILYTNNVYNYTGGATPLTLGWTGSAAVLSLFSSGAATFAGAVTATGLTLNLSSGFGSTILAGITGYNNFTLNGSNSLTTGMGMYGGASGDPALYINAPATGNVYFRIGGSDKVAIKPSGNLLVGGNTDIAGSGGLKVFGTTPSTGADSGALQVAGGIYAGAASYFGGDLNVTRASAGLVAAQIYNSTSGTGAISGLEIRANNHTGIIYSLSNAFTSSGQYLASGTILEARGSAGLMLSGYSSGPVKIWAANGLRATFDASAATFAGAVAINNTVATAVAVASTHKVTMVIGGVTYYLLASNV